MLDRRAVLAACLATSVAPLRAAMAQRAPRPPHPPPMPPQPRPERPPPPPRGWGHVRWVPGHWSLIGRRWVWRGGYWSP